MYMSFLFEYLLNHQLLWDSFLFYHHLFLQNYHGFLACGWPDARVILGPIAVTFRAFFGATFFEENRHGGTSYPGNIYRLCLTVVLSQYRAY